MYQSELKQGSPSANHSHHHHQSLPQSPAPATATPDLFLNMYSATSSNSSSDQRTAGDIQVPWQTASMSQQRPSIPYHQSHALGEGGGWNDVGYLPRSQISFQLNCRRSPTKVGAAGRFKMVDEGANESSPENNLVLLQNPSLGDTSGMGVGGGGGTGGTKRCRVCGDRAVNHNFGQLTCESCKAFFRRNAHKVS